MTPATTKDILVTLILVPTCFIGWHLITGRLRLPPRRHKRRRRK